MSWLIKPAQLDKFRKNQKNIIILDASFYGGQKNAKEEFIAKHIIGADFFDIDAFSEPDTDNYHPHLLTQDTKHIADTLSKLGIRNDYKIILYDNSDLHSSARALWMFKTWGHNPNLLYILDGGLAAWEKWGGKIQTGQPITAPKTYTVSLKTEFIRTLPQMKNNLIHPTEQVIDVRHPVRYAGGPEPRAHCRSGHIPGSFCLPLMALFDKENVFLPLDKIRKKLISIGVNLQMPIVTSCGSGMTAPVLNFVLDLLEHSQHAVYNGSWTEWGAEILYSGENTLEERPVETSLV